MLFLSLNSINDRNVVIITIINDNNNNNNNSNSNNNNNDNNKNNNDNNNMYRGIMEFLQHYGNLATFHDIFARYRTFLQHCNGYFCRIQKIILSATRPVSAALYFSLTTSLRLSDEEVQCKSNRLYFLTTKNDFYPKAVCFVEKCSFCLDISFVTSLKRYVRS